MNLEIMTGMAIALSLLMLALVVLLVLRLRKGVTSPEVHTKLDALIETRDRTERVLREEAGCSREEARSASREVRVELANLVRGVQDSIVRTMAEMQMLEKSQLELFAKQLGEGVGQIESRVNVMARALSEHLDATAQTAQAGQQRLHELLGGKLADLMKNSAESDRGLRDEVQASLKRLGDGTTDTVTRLGDVQKEKLEDVAREIGVLTTRQQHDQSELRKTVETKLGEIRVDAAASAQGLREEVTNTLTQLGETLTGNINAISQAQKDRLEQVAKEIAGLTAKQEAAQEGLRKTVEQRLDTLRTESADKLETIRKTVDEQLQGTLEKRLGESFRLVSDRLEQVHKGLGEMQSLASGVGDLKRVLTNVKARGTWGEVQLGNLLEQMLTPDQFQRDAQTKAGSQERVEFAIRLPGRGDGDAEVLLPVDAKFPHEDYDRLISAADKADTKGVEEAAKQLEIRVRGCARDIRDKYLNPPLTTDFAILFLPTEGLYAEVLRRPGLVDQIQRDYRVTITGPTTLAATLNALQMGFRTLAIQKRSSEVWQILEAVKTEFGKYGDVLDKVQRKLTEASRTIEDVSVRRRAIDRKLRKVSIMPEEQATALLGIGHEGLNDTEDDGAEASIAS